MNKTSMITFALGSVICAVALGVASHYAERDRPSDESSVSAQAAQSCCSGTVEEASANAQAMSEAMNSALNSTVNSTMNSTMATQGSGAEVDKATSRLARIPDVSVVDQHGQQMKLFSDLIQGRTVIINFFFTSCTTVCPLTASVFEQVQEQLGERLGSEVTMLSISVDPANDTPERLLAFAKAHKAKSGWHMLTGESNEIREVLRAFGVYTRDKEEHSFMAVIGHEPSGRWLYNSAMADPRGLVALIDKVRGKE